MIELPHLHVNGSFASRLRRPPLAFEGGREITPAGRVPAGTICTEVRPHPKFFHIVL